MGRVKLDMSEDHFWEILKGLGWRKVICCKECIHNYGNKYECEYNPEDIVCTYWMSDGLTEKDFCSQSKRKEE